MFATLSPASRDFEAEKMKRLEELSSNLHLGSRDSTICDWQELSALLGFVAISLRSVLPESRDLWKQQIENIQASVKQ